MTRLTIEQTNSLIEYFQSKLQDIMQPHGYTYLDATITRKDIEYIINNENVAGTPRAFEKLFNSLPKRDQQRM